METRVQPATPPRPGILEPLAFTTAFVLLFAYLSYYMGVAQFLNTVMRTAHDLLLNTVFYIMAITVLTGAFGKLLIEFGVVAYLELLLRVFMRPIYNLPGVASLGGIVTFFSDNPAIIALARDRQFASYFQRHQLVSLVNFGTAFGMGLIVITFMAGQGFFVPAFVGLAGAVVGSIVSTRIMQALIKNHMPVESIAAGNPGTVTATTAKPAEEKAPNLFLRFLNSVLDGGKQGVDLGLAIIPGVLIISTFVMLLTFGPRDEAVGYQGLAYEGVPILPAIASYFTFILNPLFGFSAPEIIALPMTALGAVGAAIGMVPAFVERGMITGNDIAVFTAIGMCWSGFLSTHTAMLDALNYRQLTSRAIISHTIAGICAGVFAHYLFLAVTRVFGL
jgi:hypothetical protein